MARPTLITDHTLDVLKNSMVNPFRLDFSAKLSPNVTFSPVYAGRVVHLNAVGEFEMGLPDVSRAGHMAIFLWQSSDSFDVSNDGGATTDYLGWQAVVPDGTMSGLVAVGGFELESTEFQPANEVPGGVYNPGDCLTATADNTNATTGGRLTKAVAYDKPICGVVSRGVYTNSNGKQVLAFWPVWLPRQTA